MFKNKDNTVSAQKFNPPTLYVDQDGHTCYVYDASSWANRNKRSVKGEQPYPAHPTVKPADRKVPARSPYML